MLRAFKKRFDGDFISISDLMSGLMMIFLFIAISFMQTIQARADQIRTIAVAYQELQADLYDDLEREFRDDLDDWQAEIDRTTLSVRFFEPEVLFEQGRADVRPRFEAILRDFFPRYLKILAEAKYRDNIEEIRIEGHTSSEWRLDADTETAYFSNMALSQDRTRAVLQLCLGLIGSNVDREWARQFITANGLSSSRLVRTTQGGEDVLRSRRVEFRTKTAAEQRVVQILEQLDQ